VCGAIVFVEEPIFHAMIVKNATAPALYRFAAFLRARAASDMRRRRHKVKYRLRGLHRAVEHKKGAECGMVKRNKGSILALPSA
jgi:hypothetical protein